MTQNNSDHPVVLDSCLTLRAAMTLHYVEENVAQEKMPRIDEENCFWSFQMDLLSRPSQMHPPMWSYQSFAIPNVTLCMPASTVSCESGTYHINGSKLHADAYLNQTVFPYARIRVWHLTFVSRHESPFTEHDLIRFAKLHTGREERCKPEASEGITVRQSTGGVKPRSLAGFVEDLTEVKNLGAPKAGTVLIDPKDCLKFCSSVRELVQIIDKTQEDPKGHDGVIRNLQALCGIVQGIHDHCNIEPAEMQDLLLPAVRMFPDYLKCRRGLLIRVEPNSRWFKPDNQIGTCPYLLIVQAAALHNEVIVAHAEHKLRPSLHRRYLAKQHPGKEELTALSKSLDGCLPDVFEYDAIRSLYRAVLRSRCIPGRHSDVRSQIKRRLADARLQSSLKIQLLLGVLNALAIVYPLKLAWEDCPVAKQAGNGAFWSVYAVFTVVLIAFLCRQHRGLSRKSKHDSNTLPGRAGDTGD